MDAIDSIIADAIKTSGFGPRATYGRELIESFDRHRWSGSDLAGSARKWGGRYRHTRSVARAALVGAITRAGFEAVEVGGKSGQGCIGIAAVHPETRVVLAVWGADAPRPETVPA